LVARKLVQTSVSLFKRFRLIPLSERVLLLLFLLTLPLANPWVRGDGVGYYAFARALLIQHNLDFAPDYQHANTSFREGRLDESGQPLALFRTATGHLENHFTIGPAILWSPFLLVAHTGVLAARVFGSSVTADGFSAPYRIAMAFGTALYGFLSLFISFRIARKFAEERWALLAALAIWGASSLPVYMYFNPSWSHAHSAFVVALFFWYWLETRERRSLPQWILLGAIAGLMLNVYYANAMVLTLVAVEALLSLRDANQASGPDASSQKSSATIFSLLASYALFTTALLLCLLPTLISKRILYGSSVESGYVPLSQWHWTSPFLLQILFSANHGLFSWTPLLLLSAIGIFLFCRKAPRVGGPVLCAALAFYYFMASYPDWAGISSYGSRFFVSLTVFFVLGLAVLLQSCANWFRSPRVAAAASLVLALLVLWNLGLMFQWGSHLIPARGPVAWNEVAHNQFFVVPRQLSGQLRDYFFRRKDLMRRIEQRDVQQLHQQTGQ
jgi:Dolichyl-phosphate-mannose-protein mannosyltransferase